MEPTSSQPGMTWLIFALLTVACWGVYGLLLHTGQGHMNDPATGRYKAFLFVCIAYALLGLVTVGVLVASGASWDFPMKGINWSILAGAAGAIGAFGVLLAFSAKGSPSVVMSIVFAGAPVVNAVVALSWHPPPGGLSAIRWPFFLGIALAALGGSLVTLFKPQ